VALAAQRGDAARHARRDSRENQSDAAGGGTCQWLRIMHMMRRGVGRIAAQAAAGPSSSLGSQSQHRSRRSASSTSQQPAAGDQPAALLAGWCRAAGRAAVAGQQAAAGSTFLDVLVLAGSVRCAWCQIRGSFGSGSATQLPAAEATTAVASYSRS
jgi:hypothetical protein